MWKELLEAVVSGNIRALARAISLTENEVNGYGELLLSLPVSSTPVIGITGPPGAGKSTITDGLIGAFTDAGKRVAVICVDPSSPFNFGALLGDRIRMSQWYQHPGVYIRSLASRGSLGGLNPKIIEITDVVRAAGFDLIIIETVGVGQSEVEIAGLADVTAVVVVPEAGDEVQTMKAGLMEIADVFVVNKSDRPDADLFVRNLKLMLAPAFQRQDAEIPVMKTVAATGQGVPELAKVLFERATAIQQHPRRFHLLAEKAWQLIQQQRMRGIHKSTLRDAIVAEGAAFNLYRFIQKF